MIRRIMKYNPAFLTADELVESFVVRQPDLERILETVHENTGRANQHVIIVGPRGVGKTTLVLRTVEAVRRDKELSSKWYPLVFGEDSYEVCSPGEFWLEALFHLARQTNLEKWDRTHRELRTEADEDRLRERALAQLMDFADERNRRILLVVENLNMILGEQIDSNSAWTLRHTLMNESRLMLLGTATSRFDEIENVGKAMFDLFRIHELWPLNTRDCLIMWTSIAGEQLSEDRIRPIEILTGGNPRLLSIVANFAAKTSFRELMLDLTRLVDDHTEYFKSQLDSLPSLERKVYVALADLWDPHSARNIAKVARVDVSKTSALLNRLVSRGAVVAIEEKGQKKRYQVAERMYNIYHLMRRRSGPSSRIRAVVNFMIHFYEREQLARTILSIAEEACGIDREQREDHYLAYGTLVKEMLSGDLKRIVLEMTPAEFLQMPEVPLAVRQSFDFARSVYETELMEDTAPYTTTKRPDLKSKKPPSGKGKDATFHIAHGDELSREPNRAGDAEKAYRKAIQCEPESAKAWVSLAWLLHINLERYEEAETAYRKAIELKPDDAWAWAWLADLLHSRLERYKEAEEAYRKAIELKPDDAWAWASLGILLHINLERYEEAETAYRKAIELEPDSAWVWLSLGLLLHSKSERYQEAEAAYRKAIELKPDSARVWARLGTLLHEKLERYEEAETAYRKAIELDANDYSVWERLIGLEILKLNDPDSAIHTAKYYIEAQRESPAALKNVACTLASLKRPETYPAVESWIRGAMGKVPKEWPFLFPFLRLLGAVGAWKDALAAAGDLLGHAEIPEHMIEEATDFFVCAAAAGYPKEALDALRGTPAASVLEPLVVGLRICVGEEPVVAREILEVGRDVAKRIDETKRKVMNGPLPSVETSVEG